MTKKYKPHLRDELMRYMLGGSMTEELSVEELAALLGLSKKDIDRAIRAKLLCPSQTCIQLLQMSLLAFGKQTHDVLYSGNTYRTSLGGEEITLDD